MTADEALTAVNAAFAEVPRPDGLFIRGSCLCEECLEHNALMAAHTPDSITYAEFGTPAWDPICMASDQAFAYYLPAMLRLAFGPDGYLDQLVFHLNQPERVAVLTSQQAQAVLDALWTLVATHEAELKDWFYLDWMGQAIDRLAAIAAPAGSAVVD